jgi:hypothetical protein
MLLGNRISTSSSASSAMSRAHLILVFTSMLLRLRPSQHTQTLIGLAALTLDGLLLAIVFTLVII